MVEFKIFSQNKNLLKQIVLHFVFIYFSLFIVNDVFNRIVTTLNIPNSYYNDFLSWLADNVFNIALVSSNSLKGNIDSSQHFITLFCCFALAILFSIIWTFLNIDNEKNNTIYYWLKLLFRFYLGIILVNYGLVKLFYLQFPEPSLSRLVKTFGNSSPMGLAWTFLGYSKGYNIFMGIAEVMAILLLFRRTLTFGLIITFFVTLNVMVINYSFDVPLKIVTTHLMLITLFLLSHDIKKIFIFFFTTKRVSLKLVRRPEALNNIYLYKIGAFAKISIMVIIIVLAGFKLRNRNMILEGQFSKTKFYGIYDVITYKKNNSPISASNISDTMWKYLVMEYNGRTEVINNKGDERLFHSEIDSLKNTLILVDINKTSDTLKLFYEMPDEKSIIFHGQIENDSVVIVCNILKKSDFILINRGFNLVSEEPFYK